MELSELVSFDNKLYAFDDRAGIIYEISKEFKAILRHIIMEGNGNIPKEMKIEWTTYKMMKNYFIWVQLEENIQLEENKCVQTFANILMCV